MLNHIVVMGRLTRDVELRRTGNGIACANFTVAVDRDFADKQSGEKETDFIDCVAWRQTGEFVSKFFKKGSMIAVSGRLQIRAWTDKDGNKRRTAEVVADNCYFATSKKDQEGARPVTVSGYDAPGYSEAEEQLAKMGYNGNLPVSDFAMLEDDDGQLPF